MNERDVFTRTRGRLTRIYSGLLILFLTLFILIVYMVLHVTILKNQEHELQTLVSQEANFIEKNFLKNNSDGLHDVQNQEVIFSGVNQYFYYVMGSNGELVMGTETDHRLRPELLRLVNSRNSGAIEIRLRTPLSVLLSSIDAIEMTMEPNKEDMSGRFLTNMRQVVKRMTRLVSDLLTLARSDSNKIELQTELFDFRLFADKAIESVRPLAASKEITLTLNAPETLKVVGDSERLSQLLYILLDNAIKYTPNGGDVRLTISEEGNTLGIAVEDTGIGIKQEDYQRIFERFYRSDKSRSHQMGGHGLGLSIAKWIVETHKGTIKVSSEVGKGSKFTIQVPKIR